MPKDYQQTLRTMTHKATVYIARHRLRLLEKMTPKQREALIAFEEAARRLQVQLGPTPYVGDKEWIPPDDISEGD